MDLKLEQVTAAIVERLNISCEECGRENIIGSEFFFCYPESPSFLTYRARLKGTSETDHGSLVLLIEAWVRGGGVSLILTGVRMTVDSRCSVTISDVNEDECSQMTTSAPVSSNRAIAAAAIGGVMATINTIALLAVVVFLFLRYCYGPISIRAVLRWTLCKIDKIVSGIVTGRAINTSSNEAYTDVEQGERQSDVYESVAVPGGEQCSRVEENQPPSTPEQSTGINDGTYEVMAVNSTL